MEKKELQTLAQKIQLEITEKDLPTYLETFNQLESLLVNFKKIKIGKKVKPMKRIEVGYLSLTDLEKIMKKYSQLKVSKKTLQTNSIITEDNFILFKKSK